MNSINTNTSNLYAQLHQLFAPTRPAMQHSTDHTPLEIAKAEKKESALTHDDSKLYKFLHDRVRDRLGEHYKLPESKDARYDQWDDHHQVADRLSALAGRLMSSESPSQAASVAGNVQNALDRGIADTRANTSPSTTQDQALNDIQQRVQDRINAYSVQGAAFHQSQKTSIKLVTHEGDVVTIDMARKVEFGYGHAEDDMGNASVFNYASETSLRYSVKGDLNEEELQSIDELLGKLDGLADGTLASPEAFAGIIDNSAIGKMSLHFSDQQDFAAVAQTNASASVNVADIFANLFDNMQNLQDLFKQIIDTKSTAADSDTQ